MEKKVAKPGASSAKQGTARPSTAPAKPAQAKPGTPFKK